MVDTAITQLDLYIKITCQECKSQIDGKPFWMVAFKDKEHNQTMYESSTEEQRAVILKYLADHPEKESYFDGCCFH